MSNHTNILRAARHDIAVAAISLFAFSCAAGAADPAAHYVNPHWAKSVYPIAHATADTAVVAGPTAPSHRIRPSEMKFIGAGPVGSWIAMYSSPYPNGKRVAWIGGYDRVAKVDADTLEVLTTHSLGGKTYFGESEIEQHLRNMDALDAQGGTASVDYGMKVWKEPWGDLFSAYRMVTEKNEFYFPQRSKVDGITSMQAYGEEDPNDPYSRIVLRREWKMPESITRAALCGINVAPDGTIVLATVDGYVVALSEDFKTSTVLKLPQREEGSRVKAAKVGAEDGFNTFVRNGITIDDKGGVYLVSRDYVYRVQWTGSALSLDEKDGGWMVPYPNSSGRGSGTTPTMMGWGPNEDHLVVLTDGDKKNNAMVIWRDKIPDAWEGLPGYDRRVAGVTPIQFGVSKNEPLQLELAPTVWGYGAVFLQAYLSDFNNNEPRLKKDSAAETWMASFFSYNKPGYGARGAVKVEWDAKTRKLNTAWRNTENYAATLPTLATKNATLYTMGARKGEWTLEGTDWGTGKVKVVYTLGKSQRFNPMFGIVQVADDGALVCAGCGFGLLRVQPK